MTTGGLILVDGLVGVDDSTAGTVTSVAMTGDNVIFNTAVTGSPITTTGTLVPSLKTQTANTVLAGPTTGAPATPTFRALVAADISGAANTALSNLAAVAINTSLLPASNGAIGLGSATLGYNLIGMSSGGVINFGNSNYLITHTAGVLTFTGAQVITSSSATALTVGPSGATNPALTVVGNVASGVTGVKITPRTAGNGVAIGVTSSSSNEDLVFTPMGSGDLVFEMNSASSSSARFRINNQDRADLGNTQFDLMQSGAASASPLKLTGTVFTGGTGTTNFPHNFIQPSGTTAVTTWSTSGTGLGMNLASGFAGNFLDFRVAGGSTLFSVSSAGVLTLGTALALGNGGTGATTAPAARAAIAEVVANYSAVGNVGGGTDDLVSTTLPANTLSAAGKTVYIYAWGTFANNANAKTASLVIGGGTVAVRSAAINLAAVWRFEGYLISTGTDTQKYVFGAGASTATGAYFDLPTSGTGALDDGATIIVKTQGLGVADNDIVCEGIMLVPVN